MKITFNWWVFDIYYHIIMVSNITYDHNELQSVSESLSKWGRGVKPTEIHNSIQLGKVIKLNDHIWQRLENTTSNNVKRGEYDKLPKTLSLRKLFMNTLFGRQQKKPIIISYDIDKYYLLDGDNELVVDKILGKKPKVIFATV